MMNYQKLKCCINIIINFMGVINFKRLNLILNTSSTGLVVTGSIAVGVTLNPIIVGTISSAGLLFKYLVKSRIIRRKLKCVNLHTQHMKKC